MTKEQQDKLRRALYNAKFTTDAEDENPFVGVYFDDLLAIIEEYVERSIYHEGWLAGEANLAKEYKNIQWIKWIPVEERLPPRAENSFIFSELVLVCDNIGYMDTAWYNFEKNRWDWLNNVTHWMPLPQPPRKEDKE